MEEICGAESWLTVIGSEYDINHVSVVLPDKRRIDDIPYNMILFNERGGHYKEIEGNPWTVVDLFLDGWQKAPRPREIGHVELTLGLAKPPIFISYHGQILATYYFVIEAEMNPRRYPVNPNVVGGELLETTSTKKLEYIKGTIENLNIREIMNNQGGVPFTKEEWRIAETTRNLEFTVDREASYLMHIEAKLK